MYIIYAHLLMLFQNIFSDQRTEDLLCWDWPLRTILNFFSRFVKIGFKDLIDNKDIFDYLLIIFNSLSISRFSGETRKTNFFWGDCISYQYQLLRDKNLINKREISKNSINITRSHCIWVWSQLFHSNQEEFSISIQSFCKSKQTLTSSFREKNREK